MTEHSNYARVAKAIEYIEQNFKHLKVKMPLYATINSIAL